MNYQLLAIALTLFGGAIVQGTVGFGLGLFSIPILVWCGLTLPQSIAATMPAVAVQTLFNCWQHRADLPWREVLPIFGLRLVSLPIGVLLLASIAGFEVARIKQCLGGFILLVLLAIWKFKPQPRESVGAGWTILAGSLSGLCAGMVGMGGPPVSLYALAHDWSTVKKRSFLWLTFLLILPIHTCLLLGRFGTPLVGAMGSAALAIPTTVLGAWCGGKLGRRLGQKGLQRAIIGLLVLIAIRSLLAPWL